VSECCLFDGRYENWTAWGAINPHVQVVIGFVFNTDSYLLQRASILSSATQYDLEQERHEAAYRKAREVFVIREKALGPEHLDTLTSVTNLAMVLQS
jgi:hypothetical protein